MEEYKYLGKTFIRTKQVNDEKGVCIGCAFNDAKTVNEYGYGCIEYSEVCDVDHRGNMIIFKEKV